jgi:hypothetical protein
MVDGPAVDFAAIVHGLRLAVFVFHRTRVLYQNEAAVKLHARLKKEYQADLIVMLRDHLLRNRELDPTAAPPPAVTLLTDARGEPLYVHVLPFGSGSDPDIAVSVRELGIEREAFARRYGLSPREAESPSCPPRLCQPRHCLHARHCSHHHETAPDTDIRQNRRRFLTQLISRLA